MDDLSGELKNAVSVTASTMLAEELEVCPLAFYEEKYLLVVKGSPEESQQKGTSLGEFPFPAKIFVLYSK